MEANKQFDIVNKIFSENEEMFRKTVAFLKKFNMIESASLKFPGQVLYDISYEDLMVAIKSCEDEKIAEMLEVLLENMHVSFSHLVTWPDEGNLAEESGSSTKDCL